MKERHEEPVIVYNMAVKDWVSYFVGQVRVYVHNGAYNGGSNTINGYIKTIPGNIKINIYTLVLRQ